VSSRVRLTKAPAEYLSVRDARREMSYEAMLGAGRTTWRVGDRVRVYRTTTGASIVADPDDETIGVAITDPRDYDTEHYVRLLRDTYASRFARAFTPDDFAALFGDPDQLSLFDSPIAAIEPVLTMIGPASRASL
jgi:DNA polymerase I